MNSESFQNLGQSGMQLNQVYFRTGTIQHWQHLLGDDEFNILTHYHDRF